MIRSERVNEQYRFVGSLFLPNASLRAQIASVLHAASNAQPRFAQNRAIVVQIEARAPISFDIDAARQRTLKPSIQLA